MQCKDWCRPIFVTFMGGMICFAHSGRAISAENEVTNRKAIAWRTSYQAAAREAAENEKPLLIEFTAVWCGACRQMQQLTFSDRRVVSYVESAFVPLVVDADAQADLVRSFRIESFPTTLVVSPELKIIKRFTGYQGVSTLLPGLEKVVQEQFAGREIVQPVSATRPANATTFGYEGFCLVSIMDDHKLRHGTAEFRTTYRDQEICFHSESHLKKFLANPGRYWPVANGKCLVSEREGQEEAQGDPRAGVTWRGRLWLFSDKASQRRFIQQPTKYVSSGM